MLWILCFALGVACLYRHHYWEDWVYESLQTHFERHWPWSRPKAYRGLFSLSLSLSLFFCLYLSLSLFVSIYLSLSLTMKPTQIIRGHPSLPYSHTLTVHTYSLSLSLSFFLMSPNNSWMNPWVLSRRSLSVCRKLRRKWAIKTYPCGAPGPSRYVYTPYQGYSGLARAVIRAIITLITLI